MYLQLLSVFLFIFLFCNTFSLSVVFTTNYFTMSLTPFSLCAMCLFLISVLTPMAGSVLLIYLTKRLNTSNQLLLAIYIYTVKIAWNPTPRGSVKAEHNEWIYIPYRHC